MYLANRNLFILAKLAKVIFALEGSQICMYVFYLAESIFRLQMVVKSIKTVISGFYGGKH